MNGRRLGMGGGTVEQWSPFFDRMAYQDHLTRQIEQLGMVLRRLLSGLTGTDVPEPVHNTLEETRQAIATSLERDPDELFAHPPAELVLHLKDHPAYSEANVDLLADLLIAMAAVDPDNATQLRLQALAVLEHLNATSTTFDMERHARVRKLRMAG